MNDLIRPALYEAWHDIVPVRLPSAGAVLSPADVVGPVCETGDTFAVDRDLPPLEEAERRLGDLADQRRNRLAAAAALNAVSPQHAHLFAATRLAGNHAGMYGAVDLASEDVRGLLERALP